MGRWSPHATTREAIKDSCAATKTHCSQKKNFFWSRFEKKEIAPRLNTTSLLSWFLALDYAHNNLWGNGVILQTRKLRVRRSQLCIYHHRHHHPRCYLLSTDFTRLCYGLILPARYLLMGPFDRWETSGSAKLRTLPGRSEKWITSWPGTGWGAPARNLSTHSDSASRDPRRGRRYSQLKDCWSFPQHHVHEVSVGDGVADPARHLRDHLLHLQVGLGDPKLLHHPLQRHQICRRRSRSVKWGQAAGLSGEAPGRHSMPRRSPAGWPLPGDYRQWLFSSRENKPITPSLLSSEEVWTRG